MKLVVLERPAIDPRSALVLRPVLISHISPWVSGARRPVHDPSQKIVYGTVYYDILDCPCTRIGLTAANGRAAAFGQAPPGLAPPAQGCTHPPGDPGARVRPVPRHEARYGLSLQGPHAIRKGMAFVGGSTARRPAVASDPVAGWMPGGCGHAAYGAIRRMGGTTPPPPARHPPDPSPGRGRPPAARRGPACGAPRPDAAQIL